MGCKHKKYRLKLITNLSWHAKKKKKKGHLLFNFPDWCLLFPRVVVLMVGGVWGFPSHRPCWLQALHQIFVVNLIWILKIQTNLTSQFSQFFNIDSKNVFLCKCIVRELVTTGVQSRNEKWKFLPFPSYRVECQLRLLKLLTVI